MCMCVFDYASVVCMDGANGKTALHGYIGPSISMFTHLSVVISNQPIIIAVRIGPSCYDTFFGPARKQL